MEVTYADKDLRELCENRLRAMRELGAVCSRKLFARVADLKAASCVLRLPAGRPHPLTGSRDGQYAIGLANEQRLVLAPDIEPVPKQPSGEIKWDAVTKVRVVAIGNRHE